MINNKKTSVVLLTALSVLALASCGGTPASSSKAASSAAASSAASTASSVASSSVAPAWTPTYDDYDGGLTISGPAAQDDWLKAELAKYNVLRKAAGKKEITFTTVAHGEDKVDSEVTDWSTGPDVYAYASDKIQGLYQAGALATISGANKTFVTSTLTAGALEAGTLAGKLISYAYAGDNGYFLYYNKSIFSGDNAEKYKTIEGINEVATAKNMKFAYPLETAFYGAGALFTYGARYTVNFTETGSVGSITADFDGDKGVAAGKAIMKIAKLANYQETQAAPTETNKLVAVVDGSWNASKYATDMGADYACAKMPTVTIDGQAATTLGSFLGYKNYGVNPQSSSNNALRLAAAHNVAIFLTGKTAQSDRFTTFKVAPTSTEVAALDEVINTPHIKALKEQAAYAVPQTAVPGNIWSAPTTFVQAVKKGDVTDANIATYLKTLNDSIKASK